MAQLGDQRLSACGYVLCACGEGVRDDGHQAGGDRGVCFRSVMPTGHEPMPRGPWVSMSLVVESNVWLVHAD